MALQMCLNHWEQCKQAIKDRGIWHLVPENGDESIERLTKQLVEGDTDKYLYDPLMDLSVMFNMEALKCGGLYLMIPDENFCPLCEAEKHSKNPEMGKIWIEGASDAILKYCQEENLQG